MGNSSSDWMFFFFFIMVWWYTVQHVAFVTYKAKLSRSPCGLCIVTCFVVALILNWIYGHKRQSENLTVHLHFSALPKSILSLTTSNTALSSEGLSGSVITCCSLVLNWCKKEKKSVCVCVGGGRKGGLFSSWMILQHIHCTCFSDCAHVASFILKDRFAFFQVLS